MTIGNLHSLAVLDRVDRRRQRRQHYHPPHRGHRVTGIEPPGREAVAGHGQPRDIPRPDAVAIDIHLTLGGRAIEDLHLRVGRRGAGQLHGGVHRGVTIGNLHPLAVLDRGDLRLERHQRLDRVYTDREQDRRAFIRTAIEGDLELDAQGRAVLQAAQLGHRRIRVHPARQAFDGHGRRVIGLRGIRRVIRVGAGVA